MKYLLSTHAGIKKPGDQVFKNTLNAYDARLARALEKYNIPIQGELELNLNEIHLDIINREKRNLLRLEKGFILQPIGTNFEYETSNYKEKVNEIERGVRHAFDFNISPKELFNFVEFNIDLYFNYDAENSYYPNNIIWAVDKTESNESVYRYLFSQPEFKGSVAAFKRLLRSEPIGFLNNVTLNLFKETQRNLYSSDDNLGFTDPAILFPEASMYDSFWIEHAFMHF